MRKYEFTRKKKKVMTPGGRVELHQIRVAYSFGNVKAGEVGGWIGKEDNLSQYGLAWVYGNAKVCGDAVIRAWTEIFDKWGILVIGPIGSRGGFTTFCRSEEKIMVACGCFDGYIDEFLEKVSEEHGGDRHGLTYQAAAGLARLQLADGEPGEGV